MKMGDKVKYVGDDRHGFIVGSSRTAVVPSGSIGVLHRNQRAGVFTRYNIDGETVQLCSAAWELRRMVKR